MYELKPKAERFSVWVGGVEINDTLVSEERAKELKAEWEKKGYDDVAISEY